MNDLPLLSGLAEVADNYQAFLVDSWGVMHDGVAPFENALDCLRELKARNKKIIILTNSARRSSVVMKELNELGINQSLIDAVVAGGEAVWQSFQEPNKKLGSLCFYLGNERSRSLFDALSLNETRSITKADFILNTGPPENSSDAEIAKILTAAIQHDIKMLCANPDIYFYFGGEKRFCAGEIARHYEALGGDVVYHGKPHRIVYKMCFEILQDIPRRQILAIGDSIDTDLKGAAAVGIDALFISNGIHRDILEKGTSLPEAAEQLCHQNEVSPIGVMKTLCWWE